MKGASSATNHAPEADVLQHIRHVIHELRAVRKAWAAARDEGAVFGVEHTCAVDGEPPDSVDWDVPDAAVFPVPVRTTTTIKV